MQKSDDEIVNCDNNDINIRKSDCNSHSSNGLVGGRNKSSKLSIDDESSHPINGSNTNNKIERKRNINMLNEKIFGMGMCGIGSSDCDDDDGYEGVDTKRIKVDGQDNNKSKMYQIYQPWVLRTYGDLSKSKTITLKKQSRILSALKGLESNRPDSSKFRFWVKSKGFIMDLPKEYQNIKQKQIADDGCLLFIPSKSDPTNATFKRVAVVEYFFNIIYKVHCCVGEGEGRHVGQKRTYRRITEYYAFLPREAVTKFLTQCNECRKSMKTTIVQEISTTGYEHENNNVDDVDDKKSSTPIDYHPKNIENYLMLLKAFYDNSHSIPTTMRNIMENHSSVRKNESFKENIQSGNSNQVKRDINININNELDNSIKDSIATSDRSLGNIIINSLDVSINVASNKPSSNPDSHYRDYGNGINNLRILCSSSSSSSSASAAPYLKNLPENQQIVTSSSEEIDDENCSSNYENQLRSKSKMRNDKNNFPKTCHHHDDDDNDDVVDDDEKQQQNTRASATMLRVKESSNIPDDILFDYHNILRMNCNHKFDSNDISTFTSTSEDDDAGTKATTNFNNNIMKMTQFTHPNREDDVKDYHHKCISSNSKTTKSHNKRSSNDIKPITSTYLSMTRSMGLADEDALNLDSITSHNENNETVNGGSGGGGDDSYANLLKDADKLKLMLLAWNYQNSAAVRNGTSGPDLSTMANLWEQYQNAISIGGTQKLENSARSTSPSNSQDDRNSPSDTKEEDDGSEDESDEKTDQTSYDPERLKAFNMFVRLFVDENLDRMIPISKQPKEKVQAIIDSCARQFPEFSERARKRLRTYLKSCRRNKKTKDGWENQPSRPTPAHLTSVQAEQILSIACENESMNAKRMRLGLEPISQSLNIPAHSSDTTQAAYSQNSTKTSMDSLTTPLSISTTSANCKTSPAISTTTDSNANSISSILSSARPSVQPTSSPYDFSTSPFMQKGSNNANPLGYYNSTVGAAVQGPTDLSVKRPLLPHNLNVTEAVAVKQLITGYREAAAFLLRSADELEQLLINQPQ